MRRKKISVLEIVLLAALFAATMFAVPGKPGPFDLTAAEQAAVVSRWAE